MPFDFIGSGSPNGQIVTPSQSYAEYVDRNSGAQYSLVPGVGYWVPSALMNAPQDAISAAGANQAGATVLAVGKNAYNVTVVGAGTGVLLPASIAGMEVLVNNNQGTNALLIYPNGTEKINAGGAGVGFSAAVNTLTLLVCFTAGQWFTK